MVSIDPDIRAAVVGLLDALTAVDGADHHGSVRALPTALEPLTAPGTADQQRTTVYAAVMLAHSMTQYIADLKGVDRLTVISAFRDLYE